MREIKFRAWDKVLEQMVTENSDFDKLEEMYEYKHKYMFNNPYWEDELYPSRDIYGIFKYFSYIANNENFEVMQYTNLQDCNGTKIYEGDIIKCKNFIVKVFFQDGAFRVKYGHIPDSFYTTNLSHFLEDYKCEVVGNIYENGSLLGELI